MAGSPPRLAELTRQEALRLLGDVPFGRVVYTVHALPAIVPVRHLVDDGMVVVRSHVGADCTGSVVAFQADGDGDGHEPGWTVTVTGVARRVVDVEEITRYEGLITPLADMPDVEVFRIFPEIVTGFRLHPIP